tara:strand:+ start:394 stop:678 length:285 start_codon:yes stop_codon:yes gene_type:complete
MVTKKKLKVSRKKIDIIDGKIFNLIKLRTRVVDQMLKMKKNKKDIIDKKRMKDIFRKIKRKSISNKIDPRITHKIWKSMIWSYVDYQKKNFKRK